MIPARCCQSRTEDLDSCIHGIRACIHEINFLMHPARKAKALLKAATTVVEDDRVALLQSPSPATKQRAADWLQRRLEVVLSHADRVLCIHDERVYL